MHPAVNNGSYDVGRIREDFPALAMQVYGKPLVYLDCAASARKPKAVLDRIQKAYTEQYANVHRSLHYPANEAYERAREGSDKLTGVPGILTISDAGNADSREICNAVEDHDRRHG